MRSYQHWTPPYVYYRLRDYFYRRANPGLPWLTPAANTYLAAKLRHTDVGAEFGSGRSTVWLARRVAYLTSVEHNQEWYAQVSGWLEAEALTNVDYLYRPTQHINQDIDSDYVLVCHTFSLDSLDFALVDGAHRGRCANTIIPYLRPGGLLIVDNADWFLPSSNHSPSSIKIGQDPINDEWRRFATTVHDWQCIWTSNGISDTALYLKP
ncbi:MAG: class I SAM-dependent methyltransferase [Anaerolineales bacterium]|nr:class I SAM-dependent methyltransferase [Anaerolineales bacterium]